jgi:hypothetical protein
MEKALPRSQPEFNRMVAPRKEGGTELDDYDDKFITNNTGW